MNFSRKLRVPKANTPSKITDWRIRFAPDQSTQLGAVQVLPRVDVAINLCKPQQRWLAPPWYWRTDHPTKRPENKSVFVCSVRFSVRCIMMGLWCYETPPMSKEGVMRCHRRCRCDLVGKSVTNKRTPHRERPREVSDGNNEMEFHYVRRQLIDGGHAGNIDFWEGARAIEADLTAHTLRTPAQEGFCKTSENSTRYKLGKARHMEIKLGRWRVS